MDIRKCILNCSVDIKTICAPLFQALPVKYFAYTSIDKKNNLVCLFSDGVWGENYFIKEYFLKDIHMFFCHDHTYNYNQYYIIDEIQLDQENQRIARDAFEFGLSHVFVMVEKNDKGFSFYHFAADPSVTSINHQYINNIDLFKKFILYFKEKMALTKKLTRIVSATTMIIPLEKTLAVPEATPSTIVQGNTFALKRFYIDDARYLTKKEQECLQLYALGQSVESIGRLFNCSPHTVEKHFENIKEKFGCHKLHHAIYQAMKLGVIN